MGGCSIALLGLLVAASGLVPLLVLLASSWGEGFSAPVQLLLLAVGLWLIVAGSVAMVAGADRLLTRRKR